MLAYGTGVCWSQVWVSEAWKTTSEEISKRTGVKKRGKPAEKRVFFPYLITLSILSQNKLSQQFSMGPNIYLSSLKKPTLTGHNHALALLWIVGWHNHFWKGFHIGGSHSFLIIRSFDDLPVRMFWLLHILPHFNTSFVESVGSW